MKKKVIIFIVVFFIVAINVIYFSSPSSIINNTDDFQIYQVLIVNSEYQYKDITAQIDCSKLAQIISTYSRSRFLHAFAPYQMTVGEIDINGTVGSKSMHILLGDIDVVYESSDKGGYTIYHGEYLTSDVLQFIKQ